MFDTTYQPVFTWRSFGLILRFDENDNIVWTKTLDNAVASHSTNLYVSHCFELSNHDIISICAFDSSNDNVNDAIIFRLNSNGDIIWKKSFKSIIPSLLNSGMVGLYTLDFNDVIEGLNGDLILTGTSIISNSSGDHETILRLTSTGDIVWNSNFGNDGTSTLGAEGVSAFLINGEILVSGISHGASNPYAAPAISFLTLDYNTGNIITKTFFKASYSDLLTSASKSFTRYYNKCIRLLNGNFLFYGKLRSEFLQTSPPIDHFGIVEFNSSLELVDAYTIQSGMFTHFYNDELSFSKDKIGVMSLIKYITNNDAIVAYGLFQNHQFSSERKLIYTNVSLAGSPKFNFAPNGAFNSYRSYFLNNGTRGFIEHKKMFSSDTSSSCSGKDTSFLNFYPLSIIAVPNYQFLDGNLNNKVQGIFYDILGSDTTLIGEYQRCSQTNYCDTIKINGPQVICGGEPSTIFTAHINPGCGSNVLWNVDPRSISAMQVINDTSLLVTFLPTNSHVTLIASLPTGSCNTTLIDSIHITVIREQQALFLGADTSLCGGNSIILHAGSNYSSYTWQNGNSDSIFIVTSPGTYYVSVSDQCGNHFTDTINISNADYHLSAGPDTSVCNHGGIQLTASTGFQNYHWQPVYNINSTVGQSVVVFPYIDTSYIVIAEKWPGCIFRDTIHISALTSPAINLGNDTSLCSTQSLILDAGSGFTHYLWNTNSTDQQIHVSQIGIYTITATALNGCISKDTLKILAIIPYPFFTLGNDTSICSGNIKSYDFNIPNASYLWQDGSISGQYHISQDGMYILSVSQSNCTKKDTVNISFKNTPVVFLGNDTTLCSGNNLTLLATNSNALYLWQDGSTLDRFTLNSAGTYFVTVNLNDCISSDTIRIAYIDKPNFTLGKDTTICFGQTITLQPQINVSADLLWSDGSTAESFLVNTPGLISLTASNKCGITSEKLVIGMGSCDLLIPNTFTPNGDNLNDIFKVKFSFPVQTFRLSIFNRYGNKLFETTNINDGWDGKYKNQQQPIGTYIWVIQLTRLNGYSETIKGFTTILR